MHTHETDDNRAVGAAEDLNDHVVREFRDRGGRVTGMFEGSDLLLLTTTGARTGREHTTPLGFVRLHGRLLVVASAGGADRHPDWYRNLLAHPLSRLEVRSASAAPDTEAEALEEHEVVAVPLEGLERDEAFAEIVRREPGYGHYQDGTDRVLPVVALDPVAEWGTEQEPTRNLADALVQVHRWLRAQLARVREDTEAHLRARERARAAGEPPPTPGLSLQIRQHCLAFCASLHTHHDREEQMFPALARSHPHLADTLHRLGEEHRTVDRLRGELEALLADVATADPECFRADLARMTEELCGHLDHEERELFPVLAEIPLPLSHQG